MADSADLIMLGGYYGTGKMGGLLSTLLLGVRDEFTGRYFTVCKCGNGMTDDEIGVNQASVAVAVWLRRAFDARAGELGEVDTQVSVVRGAA